MSILVYFDLETFVPSISYAACPLVDCMTLISFRDMLRACALPAVLVTRLGFSQLCKPRQTRKVSNVFVQEFLFGMT